MIFLDAQSLIFAVFATKYLPVFFVLTLVHFLYDWHWQGDVGIWKAKSKVVMHIHCSTWALLLTGVLFFFGGKMLIPAYLFLHATHFGIDTWKCSLREDIRISEKALLIDQLLHLLTVVIVLLLVFK